jgi:hypothetical protein
MGAAMLRRLILNLAYRFHRADEYLAYQRGDYLFAADCANRAEECQRQLDTIAINRRFGHGT